VKNSDPEKIGLGDILKFVQKASSNVVCSLYRGRLRMEQQVEDDVESGRVRRESFYFISVFAREDLVLRARDY
jgi:hypothetical protein